MIPKSMEKPQSLSSDWRRENMDPDRMMNLLTLRTFVRMTSATNLDLSFPVKQKWTTKDKEAPRFGITKALSSPSRWRNGIPEDCVRLIGDQAKADLFEEFIPIPQRKIDEAEELLRRVGDLSPEAAKSFAIKEGNLKCLTFRLILPNPEGGRNENGSAGWWPTWSCMPVCRTEPKGYYALSYRWRSTARVANNARCTWTKGMKPHNMALPTSDVMFAAIMDELPKEEGWGLWCDQICINEADVEERNKTVGMMDVIYRRAAKVIVALDDIEVENDEVEALEEFEAWHDHHSHNGRVPEDEDFGYVKTRPLLRSCVEKIVYSEYFERAWCAHEFELANDRLVLIRAGKTEDGRCRIVRIPNDKLHTLMLLLSLDTKATISPEQAGRRVNVELLISRPDRNDPSSGSSAVHDMQTLALINSMEAGGDPTLPQELRPYSAIRDKVSILLNACECNLEPSEDFDIAHMPLPLAHARTLGYVSLLMLAFGNPMVLATTGRPLLVDATHESWLRTFWLLDAGIDTHVPLLKIPLNFKIDPTPGCRWIRLNLIFPSKGGYLHIASKEHIQRADAFITDFCETHRDEIIGSDATLLQTRKDHLTHLIACILECKACWYGNKAWRQKSGEIKKPWQYFFGDALDQLPVKISNGELSMFHGSRGNAQRVADALSKEESQTVDNLRRLAVEAPRTQEQKTAVEMAGELMGNLLLTAPIPDSRGDSAAWRPCWFEVGNGKKYIAMAPREPGEYRVAVPEALKASDYADLSRCWILQPKNEEADGHWIIRNRSKLMMPDDSLEPEITHGSWYKMKHHTVWGRTLSAVVENSD